MREFKLFITRVKEKKIMREFKLFITRVKEKKIPRTGHHFM